MKTVKLLVTFGLLVCLASCASYGGGTIGTGMSLGSGRTKPINTGVSYVNLTGRLMSTLNKPIEGAEVTVSTERSEESATSDFDGRFILTLVAKQGERVKVKVAIGSSIYTETFVVNEQNINHGQITVTILPGGKVRLSNINWYN